jgi:hypothetical protein
METGHLCPRSTLRQDVPVPLICCCSLSGNMLSYIRSKPRRSVALAGLEAEPGLLQRAVPAGARLGGHAQPLQRS